MRILCILASEWVYPSLIIRQWFLEFLGHYSDNYYTIMNPHQIATVYEKSMITGYDAIFVCMHGIDTDVFISGVTILTEKFLFNKLPPDVDLAMNVCFVNPPQNSPNKTIYWDGALEGISLGSPMKDVLRIQLDTYMQSKSKEYALQDAYTQSKACLEKLTAMETGRRQMMLIHNNRVYKFRS